MSYGLATFLTLTYDFLVKNIVANVDHTKGLNNVYVWRFDVFAPSSNTEFNDAGNLYSSLPSLEKFAVTFQTFVAAKRKKSRRPTLTTGQSWRHSSTYVYTTCVKSTALQVMGYLERRSRGCGMFGLVLADTNGNQNAVKVVRLASVYTSTQYQYTQYSLLWSPPKTTNWNVYKSTSTHRDDDEHWGGRSVGAYDVYVV